MTDGRTAGRDGAPAEPERLLLFMPPGRDRDLLESWLEERYDVVVGAESDALDQPFDLCLVGEATYRRTVDSLAERKARAEPGFLPYLLVVGEDGLDALDVRTRSQVDDVVTAPVSKAELAGRIRNLLARRRLSVTLATQHARFAELVAAIPDPLLVADESGAVVEVNHAFEVDTGCPVVTGTPLDDVEAFSPETAAALTAAAADPGPAEDLTVTVAAADGTQRTADVGVAALTADAEEETQTLFVFRDVTDRIERERELERERDRLDAFAAMLAHETRNPLNIAQGNLDLLTPATPRDGEFKARVETALARVEKMIDELLAHARGGLLGTIQPVDLARAARNTWTHAETGDAILEVAHSDATVDADPDALRIALDNLFRNAAEHAGASPTIRVGVLSGGGFYVEDDGRGILEADRERVLEHGFTTSPKGTGLGLALVRQIADEHGWELSVLESDTGGARFEFRP